MKKLLTISFSFGLIYFLPQQMHANLNQEQEEEVEVVEAPAEEAQEEPQMTVAEAPSVGFTQELKNRFTISSTSPIQRQKKRKFIHNSRS